VAIREIYCHWGHGVRSLAEETHDSKLREPSYENEAEPHLAGICSHQNIESVKETASFPAFFEHPIFFIFSIKDS
jgi:hypothetical protein